ncbi:MAG: MEDS domain-containing protein [Pirellulales bacterium]|nr:MEDS domain-containing protein [Pirellulales bacterium]
MTTTGIQIVGDVPWGTHFCQLYQTKQDLIDILVPYFREGLRRNEFCLWITSSPLQVAEARKALHRAVPDLDGFLQRGQIEILDYRRWYVTPEKFDADRVLQGWIEKERFARQQGYAGLRLTGNIFWLEESDWQVFSNYEAAMNEAIGRYRVLAVCSYCLKKCRTFRLIDAVNNHQFTIIKQDGAWKLFKSRQAEEALRRAGQLQILTSELTMSEQRQRRRLSQHLHDHLQQLLYAARLSVTALHRRVQEELQPTFHDLDLLLGQCIDECRWLTVELSPAILYDAGLAAALEWLARQMLQNYGLTVEVQTDGEVESESEDVKVLLFSAVRELLLNVVKHARTKTARIELYEMPGRQIGIEVADDGIGIPGMNGHGAVLPGAGFGLFSIRERLELMGGRLEIQTTAGKGTRVKISFPSRQPPSTASNCPSPTPSPAADPGPAPANHESPRPVAKIRILIADDHAVFRKGLLDLLRQEPDLEVVGEAADGEAAVEQARRHHPDLVLMDVAMPRADGMEATRRITAELPGVRIIGLSAHREEDIAQALYKAGAVSYLSKDEPVELLIAAIRSTAARPAADD